MSLVFDRIWQKKIVSSLNCPATNLISLYALLRLLCSQCYMFLTYNNYSTSNKTCGIPQRCILSYKQYYTYSSIIPLKPRLLYINMSVTLHYPKTFTRKHSEQEWRLVATRSSASDFAARGRRSLVSFNVSDTSFLHLTARWFPDTYPGFFSTQSGLLR